MSAGVTPASAKAFGPDHTAPVWVRSMRPEAVCFTASPWPSTVTAGRANERATSGLASTRAPPPSVITQQSSRCSGSATIGDASTCSTVTTSRRKACGLCWACSDAATLTSASCADVVPYSCMCRRAAMA